MTKSRHLRTELSGRTNHVSDTLGLRRDVYRVLLTRGREGAVLFVPDDPVYDETYRALLAAGARELEEPGDLLRED